MKGLQEITTNNQQTEKEIQLSIFLRPVKKLIVETN